jgi:hypothetical protein
MDTTELLTQQEAATRLLMKPVKLAKRRQRRGRPGIREVRWENLLPRD